MVDQISVEPPSLATLDYCMRVLRQALHDDLPPHFAAQIHACLDWMRDTRALVIGSISVNNNTSHPVNVTVGRVGFQPSALFMSFGPSTVGSAQNRIESAEDLDFDDDDDDDDSPSESYLEGVNPHNVRELMKDQLARHQRKMEHAFEHACRVELGILQTLTDILGAAISAAAAECDEKHGGDDDDDDRSCDR